MKKFLVVLLFLIGTTALYSQTPIWNQAWNVYSKVYTASTANDTTNFIRLTETSSGHRSGTTDIKFFGRSNDSIAVVCFYRLKNSLANITTGWTEIDTVIHVQTSDSTSAVGSIALSTLLGYDEIQFYFDWLAASAGTNAVSNLFRWYMYLVKNEDR